MTFELASTPWEQEEIEAIQQTILSGRFTMGEKVRQFENLFAKKFDVKYALMTSSGSSANLVGVASLFYLSKSPLERGDEVIVPSVSWSTTYYPLQQYGLRLRFIDIKLETLNIDVAQLENALTPRTRMVVAVNILGNPADLDLIRQFCDKHDLILFEDNCESMGAKLNGKFTGTFGDIGTFSTFYSHHISTMEGGLLVTDDAEIYHLAKSIRAHGWTRDLPERTDIYEKKDDDFFEAYRFILPGYNARPLELSGAIGVIQLEKLDQLIEIRRRNAEVFVELFQQDDRFIIQRENGKSSWFSFTLIINPETDLERKSVLSVLRENGIQFRIITGGCFLRHDVIRYFDYDTVGEIINANIAHDRGFFIGNHPRDIRAPIKTLHRVLSDNC